jgi:hypothetical protein
MMICFSQSLSPYRTVNTIALGYKNRSVNAVFSQIHTKHTSTLCGQNVEFVSIKPMWYI